MADGQEVHYSSSRSGVFEHSWTMRGNHVLKVVAHASPPLSPTPGFRQYDFFVDGQTFFSFPKVYRLGLAPNDPRNAVSPPSPVKLADRGNRTKNSQIVSLEAPHNPDEEEAYLREAIRNSLEEQKKAEQSGGGAAPQISSQGQSLLLDFLEDPGSAPGSMPALPPSTTQEAYGFASPAASTPALPPSQNGYGQDPYGYGAPQGGPGAMVPYAAPAPGGSQQQPYPGAPPQQQYYGLQQQYSASPFEQPPPVQTAPASITPMAQASPSTLGFNSPQPDFGFQSPPPKPQANDNDFVYGGSNQAQYGGGDQFAGPPQQQYGGAQFAQPPSQQPPSQQQQYGGRDQFAQPSQQPPPQQQQYGGGDPFSQSTQQQQSYGGGNDNFSVASGQLQQQPQFGSRDQGSQYGDSQQPTNDQFGQQPPRQPDQQQQQSSEAGNSQTLTMNSLQGHEQGLLGSNGNSNSKSGSLADAAYAKFASMDQFDLVSKKDTERANPFEAQPVEQQKSLADMRKEAKVNIVLELCFLSHR